MDGLRTLARIEQEARTAATLQRKWCMEFEAQRARKRRKMSAGHADGMEVVAHGSDEEAAQMMPCRHSLGSSIAGGGERLAMTNDLRCVLSYVGCMADDGILFV
jgi:hypothetical protein